METRTFADLYSLIESLCGVSFATLEQARIKALVNRRATRAYRASNYWPRYLVIGEERAVTSNVIPYTEGSLAEIDTFLRIHRTEPWVATSAQEFTFFVDAAGARITAGTIDPASAFVTYKEAWTPAITANSTDIPGEFFDYIAHGNYEDFMRAEGQQEKAALADAEAADILTDELFLIDEQGTMQIVANRVSTNLNMQTR